MALTEDDVRRALSDPILQKMDFWIDSIHVRAEASVHLSGVNGISAKPSLRPARETVDPPTKDRFSAQDAYKVPSDSLFAFNSHDLGNGPQPALEMAAEYIKTFKGPGARVYITGHTDNIGNKGFNLTLSVQRAQAVAKWLVDHNSVKPGD